MTWTVPLLLVLAIQPTPALPPELLAVERTLRNEKIDADGPGLLAYVKAQTHSAEDEARLRRLVRDLGDDDFDMREAASRHLVEAGPKAIPYLRPALKSGDVEVVRRARLCLESLVESPLAGLMPGVVRLLGERNPDGTVAVLLAYLPSAGDEAVEDAVFDLLRVAVRPGAPLDPAVVAALASPHPVVRAAAAHALGELADAAAARRLLGPLLEDESPRVRFEAGQALVRNGEPAGIPALVVLVESGPRDLAGLADEVLSRLTSDRGSAVPPPGADDDARRASAAGWKAWWERTASRAGWSPPAGLRPYLGRTLVVEFDTNSAAGAIYELGRDGKPRWRIGGLRKPNDVWPLADGRFLVAERDADRVGEYDRNGKLHWSVRTADSPIACQRLADGTTLVVTFTEVLRVDGDGKKLASFRHGDGLRGGRARPDGGLVAVSAQGEVIELAADGKVERRFTPAAHAGGAGYWAAVEPLGDGRYLVCFGGTNKVVEMGRDGRIDKEWNVSNPVSVSRLRNGNTLVATFEGRRVVEIDRAGKEVWQATTQGRPFAAVRY